MMVYCLILLLQVFTGLTENGFKVTSGIYNLMILIGWRSISNKLICWTDCSADPPLDWLYWLTWTDAMASEPESSGSKGKHPNSWSPNQQNSLTLGPDLEEVAYEEYMEIIHEKPECVYEHLVARTEQAYLSMNNCANNAKSRQQLTTKPKTTHTCTHTLSPLSFEYKLWFVVSFEIVRFLFPETIY